MRLKSKIIGAVIGVAVPNIVFAQAAETPAGVYNRGPDWSPDGTRLAFESDREEGKSALFTMSASGGVAQRITAVSGYEGHPAWSPNGQSIAFESTDSGAMEIYVTAADGGDAQRLTSDGGHWPRWSPDGGRIIYASFGEDMPNLWTVTVD